MDFLSDLVIGVRMMTDCNIAKANDARAKM